MKRIATLIIGLSLILCGCGAENNAQKPVTQTSTQSVANTTPEVTGKEPPKDYSGEKVLEILPDFQDKIPALIKDCGDSAYMRLYETVTLSEFSEYVKALEQNGFSLLYHRDVNGSAVAAAYTDGFIVNLTYTAFESVARIIAEPCASHDFLISEPPAISSDDSKITITQIGQDYSGAEGYQSGMSYVIRLSDGSFIIVDGGYYRLTDAVRIYECMKEQSDGVIVISAWILTHAHSDHIGAFIKFADSYSTLVTLKRIICNFPSDADCAVTGDPQYLNECRQAMKKFEGAEVIKAHTGNRFEFSGFTAEILYTTEQYYPDVLDIFNLSSMVIRFEFGGTSMLILGDMMMESSRIISYMYGNLLKSDIVQVAHHGAKGGSTDLYRLISPTYAFWPVGAVDYENYKGLSRNSYITTSETIKSVFVARGDIIKVELNNLSK